MVNVDVAIDSCAKITPKTKFAYVVLICDYAKQFLGAVVCYSKHHAVYFTNRDLFLQSVRHLTLFVLGGYQKWDTIFSRKENVIINDSLVTKNGTFYETLRKVDFVHLSVYRRIYSSCIAACRMLDFH